MWFFSSPQIVFGEGSLAYLERLQGRKAMIVTDATLVKLGYVDTLRQVLAPTGMQLQIYDAIEPDPSLETVQRGAQALLAFEPDWIIALGGGSVIDAAKGMWVLYERPDITPDAINPVETLGLRARAHLVAIPTTAGTGSEATWAVVLSDPSERRKLGLGNREDLPDLAILDPELVLKLPPRLTADTGLDVLTHAIEGYTSNCRNDFSDGLCLKAAQLVFDYLPACYRDGSDVEARTHMQNAAAIAGLGFGNSMAALAHGMGHSLGYVFHIPHGRAVALFLPYTIEYCLHGGGTRYAEIARFLGLPAASEEEGAHSLVSAIRKLEIELDQPRQMQMCGIQRGQLEGGVLNLLVQNALNDSQTMMSTRIPDPEEMRQLFLSACE
jgi:alcohol dehydrogenase class IV